MVVCYSFCCGMFYPFLLYINTPNVLVKKLLLIIGKNCENYVIMFNLFTTQIKIQSSFFKEFVETQSSSRKLNKHIRCY